MIVRFASDARQDLIDIGDYVAADSPRQALRLVLALREKALDLRIMAERFPAVGLVGDERIRRRAFGRYSIFYYVNSEKEVVIARILHSARDHERILFPES